MSWEMVSFLISSFFFMSFQLVKHQDIVLQAETSSKGQVIPQNNLNKSNTDSAAETVAAASATAYANPTQVQSRPKKIRFNLEANVLFEDDNEYKQYGEFLKQNNYTVPSTHGASNVNYRRNNDSNHRVNSPMQESDRDQVRSEPLPHSDQQARHQQPRSSHPTGPSIPTAASSSIHLLRKRLNPRHSKTIDRLANLFHQVK